MYKIVVCAVFKNEEFGIVEWIEHYLYFGVEHFYLINDESIDNWKEKIQNYINNKIVTIFNNDIPKLINNSENKNRQIQMYNKYFMNIKNQSEWILIVDLDEYVYSPANIKFIDILNKYNNFSEINVYWLMFGSNNYIIQPKNIRKSFTKRTNIIYSYKSFVKGNNLISFGIHNSTINGYSYKMTLDSNYNAELICNHYRVQSKEYWEKIAMKRGDADCNESEIWRNWDIFDRYNHNEIEDLRLYNII